MLFKSTGCLRDSGLHLYFYEAICLCLLAGCLFCFFVQEKMTILLAKHFYSPLFFLLIGLIKLFVLVFDGWVTFCLFHSLFVSFFFVSQSHMNACSYTNTDFPENVAVWIIASIFFFPKQNIWTVSLWDYF